MTICDITSAYTPASGGIRTYLHAKRRFLLAHTPHRHIMIVPGTKDDVVREGRAVTYRVRGLPIPGCAPYRALYRLDKVLGILRHERPDILELGTAYALPWAAFRFRRRSGAAVIGFCHTDYVHAYVQPFLTRRVPVLASAGTGLAQRHFRWVYENCDAVFAASDAMIGVLTEAGVRAVKMPLGVDVELFHPARRDETFRRNLGVGPDQVLVAYAGRLDEEKRINVLLDAFRLARPRFDGTMLIVGDGPSSALVDAVASACDRIGRLPYQHDRRQLARILASADIYVTAGPHETFALSVVEAQASGLPVVGVRAGALIERVPDSLGLLGEVDSAQSMAENLIALSCNGMRDKGKAARTAVEAAFSWDMALRRLVSAYEGIRGALPVRPS